MNATTVTSTTMTRTGKHAETRSKGARSIESMLRPGDGQKPKRTGKRSYSDRLETLRRKTVRQGKRNTLEWN